MDGILLIDKPKDWTSFDVVGKVRGILKQAGLPKPKVGHTGTLDPQATGLLVLVVGSYTKRAQELTKLDKTYDVTMKLGETSTTGDSEGEKTVVSTKRPSETDVKAAINDFIGEIQQVPPKFSAIKIGGQRAYKLARAGQEVKLEPRTVHIYGITDVHYSYPVITFTASVSSGTYIRSLVEDIGTKLAVGAYMSDLRRTKVGEFSLENALVIESLNAEMINSSLQILS